MRARRVGHVFHRADALLHKTRRAASICNGDDPTLQRYALTDALLHKTRRAASICNGDEPTLQRPTPKPPPALTPCSRPTLSTKHDFARYTISRDPVNSYLPVVVARPAAKAIFPCLCANMRRAPFPNSGRD